MTGIEVAGLSFSYGPRVALEDVGFGVGAGEFAALLGPNGAGKSTLFALLTRLFTAHQGEIRLAGENLATTPGPALAKVGVVFQQPTLDLDLSVRRNLRYFSALHGIPAREADIRLEAALDRLDMRERADERVRDLNGGHRRRVEIARALLHQPSVLLLDEPTVGLDVATRTALVDHVHSLADDGLAVLWATHLTDEIRQDDRVIVLHRGKVLANCSGGELADGGDLSAAYLRMTRAEA